MVALAILLSVAGFLGDWANNSEALLAAGMSLDFGTVGRVCIALLFAGAVSVLGYAASFRRRYALPALSAVLGSACLTLYAQWSYIDTRDAVAKADSSRRPALSAERDDILSALPSCRSASWCDSQAKESRLREIDAVLSKTPSVSNPGGKYSKYLSSSLLVSLSLLLPFVNFGLSSFAGHMISCRNPKSVPKQKSNTPKKPKQFTGNVVNFKKKLIRKCNSLGNTIKSVPKSVSKSVSAKAKVLNVKHFNRRGNTTKDWGNTLDALSELYNTGKKPSVRSVMSVRSGSERVVKGKMSDIGETLKAMSKKGILVAPTKKGQGYKYDENYWGIKRASKARTK